MSNSFPGKQEINLCQMLLEFVSCVVLTMQLLPYLATPAGHVCREHPHHWTAHTNIRSSQSEVDSTGHHVTVVERCTRHLAAQGTSLTVIIAKNF